MSPTSERPSVAIRIAALDALPEGEERQPAILAALEEAAPAVRERAIRLAARYVEPAVLGELVADDTNAARRNGAIAALERQGPYALPQLQSMLGLENLDVAMFALQVLARIGDPAPTAAILPLLRHPNLNVAQSAIEALGQLRSREAVPALLGLLRGELWLQLAAIDALGAIGDPRAVGPLVELVPDSVVAEPALESLQRLAAPESLEPLLACLVIVRERSLLDALLLAVGVVIDLHPDPAPAAARLRDELALGHGDALLPYLEQVLNGTAASGDLLRAAAALTVVAGLEALLPLVLHRIADPEGAPWAEALFRRHPDALRGSLDRLLGDADARIRRGALLAAGFGPDDLPTLVNLLGDPEAPVRAAACRALGSTGAEAVAPLLAERLRSGEPIERAAAVQGLALLPPAALGELEPCLAPGAAEEVTIRALEVLGLRPHAAFEARILELAGSRSTALRRAALRAVAQIGGSRADVTLVRALADRSRPVQLEALELLVRRGGERTAVTLSALLSAGDSLRYHVIRALGHLRAEGAAGKLRALYPECGPHERLEIVSALIRIAPRDLAEFLRARLEEPEAELRRIATGGLAELADPAQLPLLLTLAEDADWNVRNEAARGLGLLGLPACRPPLLTLVRDVEPVVARTARKALDALPSVAIPA
ncbi:MAG: HEAT repeat domain-containing protein [Gemmatimonadales bacterium]|nr:HEAT repeat domain-containing protein [Gemmatimonadales bacterium]